MTIWKLVEQCAKELTENGISPFTRSDIIKCIQRKNASYGPDSINPIIQGLADNLRGGAPGAVGKNILHNVGRGLFVLNMEKLEPDNHLVRSSAPHRKEIADSLVPETSSQRMVGHNFRRIGGYGFIYICDLEPERNTSGDILTLLPQARFDNTRGLSMNNYGKGPFCKFTIPRGYEYPGVYALLEANDIKYIGECVALSSRYNTGYGNISPRNCYVGGQETNCRINNLILQQVSAGLTISLWFFYTFNHKIIETQLRTELKPSWNRV